MNLTTPDEGPEERIGGEELRAKVEANRHKRRKFERKINGFYASLLIPSIWCFISGQFLWGGILLFLPIVAAVIITA